MEQSMSTEMMTHVESVTTARDALETMRDDLQSEMDDLEESESERGAMMSADIDHLAKAINCLDEALGHLDNVSEPAEE